LAILGKDGIDTIHGPRAETEGNRAGLKGSDFLTVLGNEIKRRGGR
jgi:hypothetical protein